MAQNNRRRLSHQEVQDLLASLQRASSREECRSCECLQGFIAQLELDAVDDARPLLEEWRADSAHVHKGRSCEPCAPAEVFAEYLMRKREM